MKIHPVESEVFHADEQTDIQTEKHDKADSQFSKFWEWA